jgi:alkanesulfonate monooxygenase SsuD/methylene tetrahydromethanopterin reductase-like flavin-dependent oxidoreductase (luciferase family)
MRYGVTLPNIGLTIGELVDLAVLAEATGWDGVFVWDCISIDHANLAREPTWDVWIAMAAIAARTTRVRIGPMIAPLSRRRPWKVAREALTLDHLSGGRLTLPVGLGAIDDGGFSKVGEQLDRKLRAEMLDESLAILTGLWSGEPFSYEGKHYRVQEMIFQPPPVQPRIPIWVVGAWPRMKSMRRVLRYDGLLPNVMQPDGSAGEATPADIAAMRAFVAEQRGEQAPLDIVMEAPTPGDDPARAAEIVRAFAEAGATWWLEAVWAGKQTTYANEAAMRERIRQGPPLA